MKKILLLMVAAIIATVSFAQSQIATLSHGDQIQTFYGPSGFASAMTAADHGDIITLSSGTFTATNITKAVTLRGAGMVGINDEVGFLAPTIIEGLLSINIPTEIEQALTIDGVNFASMISYHGTLKNPVFTKCKFYVLRGVNSGGAVISNAVFINCRVSSFSLSNFSTASCINCVLYNPSAGNNINSAFEFINCILTGVELNSMNHLGYSSFKNCYINMSSQSSPAYFPASSNFSNCYSSNSAAFKNSTNLTNKIVPESEMFVSYTGTPSWDDSQKFVLTEEAAKKYLGDDGTQMGIYGGNMPFEERVSIPYITKCNVAGKSTADGKLSVDIQVKAAQ